MAVYCILQALIECFSVPIGVMLETLSAHPRRAPAVQHPVKGSWNKWRGPARRVGRRPFMPRKPLERARARSMLGQGIASGLTAGNPVETPRRTGREMVEILAWRLIFLEIGMGAGHNVRKVTQRE